MPDTARPGSPAAPPLEARSRWAVRGLALIIAVDLAAILNDLSFHSLLNRAAEGSVTLAEAEAMDRRQQLISIVALVALAGAGFVFIRWLHTAYRDLRRRGVRDLRFGPGWAIGGWFVPILGLWRPKEVVNDVWRGTDLRPQPGIPWHDRPVSPLLTWWWGLFLTNAFLGRVAERFYDNAHSIGKLRSALNLDIAAQVCDAVAAILAILVVLRMTERWRVWSDRAERPAGGEPPGDGTSSATSPPAPSP